MLTNHQIKDIIKHTQYLTLISINNYVKAINIQTSLDNRLNPCMIISQTPRFMKVYIPSWSKQVNLIFASDQTHKHV